MAQPLNFDCGDVRCDKNGATLPTSCAGMGILVFKSRTARLEKPQITVSKAGKIAGGGTMADKTGETAVWAALCGLCVATHRFWEGPPPQHSAPGWGPPCPWSDRPAPPLLSDHVASHRGWLVWKGSGGVDKRRRPPLIDSFLHRRWTLG